MNYYDLFLSILVLESFLKILSLLSFKHSFWARHNYFLRNLVVKVFRIDEFFFWSILWSFSFRLINRFIHVLILLKWDFLKVKYLVSPLLERFEVLVVCIFFFIWSFCTCTKLNCLATANPFSKIWVLILFTGIF